jgi:hypothetical protein
LKISNLQDLARNRKKLEQSIPKVEDLLNKEIDNFVGTTTVLEKRQFSKIMSLSRQLWRNRGMLTVLNLLSKEPNDISSKREARL